MEVSSVEHVIGFPFFCVPKEPKESVMVHIVGNFPTFIGKPDEGIGRRLELGAFRQPASQFVNLSGNPIFPSRFASTAFDSLGGARETYSANSLLPIIEHTEVIISKHNACHLAVS